MWKGAWVSTISISHSRIPLTPPACNCNQPPPITGNIEPAPNTRFIAQARGGRVVGNKRDVATCAENSANRATRLRARCATRGAIAARLPTSC